MNCTVLGAGSWGIALAVLLNENGHNVSLWEFNKDACDSLSNSREEKDKLPGIIIDKKILISSDLVEISKDSEFLINTVPTRYIRGVYTNYKETIDFSKKIIVNCSKGIENDSLKRISEVIKEVIGISDDQYVVLSGPSHAEEVAKKLLTVVTSASTSIENAKKVQELFGNKSFRVYTNDDVIGVELASALKNVIAIAAGASDGFGLGDNAKSALLTRGAVEIARLGVVMGAKQDTFYGLSGIGDLATTCFSPHSRNRYVGNRLGKGENIQEILDSMLMEAEGVYTVKAAVEMSKKFSVDMPITEAVYNVLYKNANVMESIGGLMGRQQISESF